MFRDLAEIECFSCGRALGQIQRRGAVVEFVPAPEGPHAAALQRKAGVGVACGRCGGRAVVGPFERVLDYQVSA